MILIRECTESDALQVGVLIADTYSQYHLAFASPEQKQDFLGPFQYARSPEKSHQEAIADVIKATVVRKSRAADEMGADDSLKFDWGCRWCALFLDLYPKIFSPFAIETKLALCPVRQLCR